MCSVHGRLVRNSMLEARNNLRAGDLGHSTAVWWWCPSLRHPVRIPGPLTQTPSNGLSLTAGKHPAPHCVRSSSPPCSPIRTAVLWGLWWIVLIYMHCSRALWFFCLIVVRALVCFGMNPPAASFPTLSVQCFPHLFFHIPVKYNFHSGPRTPQVAGFFYK